MSNVPDPSRHKPSYLTQEDIFGPKVEVASREVFLMDEDGNEVDAESGKARRFVATEYDAEGNMISETFGYIGDPWDMDGGGKARR